MTKIIYTLSFVFFSISLFSQGFTNWITGDSSDFVTDEYQKGILLAGGGIDNDDAMRWMLNRAGGGDVVVIRASNSDGYNDYFFSELGVNVHSVETIRFDSDMASTNDYVINRIRNAEILFIAGGDQFDYYEYWKDTPIEDAINYLINEKGITIGGTSAGMAILGGAYYTPSGGSLDSEEALADPFHQNINILGNGDFIENSLLVNVVTDTHYDQRDRQGRHLTFLARIMGDWNVQSFGIACNEVTAVCINEEGIATIFGEYPDYDDYAYFIKSNCQIDPQPEVLIPNIPLTWNRNQAAVKVYKVPGLIDGSTSFDLNNWESGDGGNWEAWYVENGELLKKMDSNSDCDESTSTEEINDVNSFKIFPNPFSVSFTIQLKNDFSDISEVRLLNHLGQIVWSETFNQSTQSVDLRNIPVGNYFIEIQNQRKISKKKISKQ